MIRAYLERGKSKASKLISGMEFIPLNEEITGRWNLFIQ